MGHEWEKQRKKRIMCNAKKCTLRTVFRLGRVDASETKCKAAAFGSYCHAKMITPIWPSQRETICEAFMVFLLDAGRSLINCFFQSRRNLSVEKL